MFWFPMLERVTQISIRHVCKMYLQVFISNSEEDASELLRNHKEIVINGKVVHKWIRELCHQNPTFLPVKLLEKYPARIALKF